MPRAWKISIGFAALLAAATARAQAPVLTHTVSIYEDEKGQPLKAPEGVACGDGEKLVVADTGNGRLLRLLYRNGVVSGGTPLVLSQLPYPVRLQLDGQGVLWVLDRKVRRIGRVDASGAFAGYLEVKGVPPESVVPGAFKLDAGGNVYLLDLAGVRALVLDASGAVQRQLDLPKKPAFFTDLAVDPAGTVYAVDASGGAVWSAPKAAKAFTLLAKGLKDNMSFPGSLTVSRGRLYVVDQNGDGVVVLGLDGTYQGRQLGIGWSEGLVYYPGQLCLDEGGSAFLADRYNNRVQIFSMKK